MIKIVGTMDTKSFLAFSMAIIVMAALKVAAQGPWQDGHATFYGDNSGGGTMGGSCGYTDHYGVQTTALSPALYNNGTTCGACYEVKCVNDAANCASGSIVVTATNICPAGGPCSPPQKHFDLTMPMFQKIATNTRVGNVPIQFRRVNCGRQGGIRFQLTGNPNFLLALVFNVGGDGDVTAVDVKGSGSWISMTRNWGQNWSSNTNVVGQALSFRVTTSDGKALESDNVAPSNWEFGKTYEGKQF